MISQDKQPLRCISYVSRARVDTNASMIDGLVKHAQQKNTQLGVTGLLCFKRGWFLQYIEGPDASAQALMAEIDADARHEVIRSTDQFPIASRRFSTWSMRLADDNYLATITLEDIIFDNVSIHSPDDPNGEWWNELVWRSIDKLAALHANKVV